MTWSFDRAAYPFLRFGGAAAAAAEAVLADGPIGLFWQRDLAREFQACGEAIDLSGIHTTCAVFASACWYWAGRPLHHTRASRIGTSISGWLDVGHAAWVPHGHARPDVGDVIGYGASESTVHHVELVVEVYEDGTIRTAHGGDSPTYPEILAAGLDHAQTRAANGTVARLGAAPKTLVGVAGWYSAAAVAATEGL